MRRNEAYCEREGEPEVGCWRREMSMEHDHRWSLEHGHGSQPHRGASGHKALEESRAGGPLDAVPWTKSLDTEPLTSTAEQYRWI